MRGRAQDRLAALVSIGLLAALAAFSYYVAEFEDRSPGEAGSVSPDEPDYFVEGFSVTRLDASGRPAYNISARRMEHYLAADRVVLDQPVATSLDPNRPPVTVRAEHGRSDTRGEVTVLEDDVRLVRLAGPERPELVVETDRMVLDTLRDLVHGEGAVTVRQDGSFLTGVGFELNNATRQLRLDSRVKALLVPQPPT